MDLTRLTERIWVFPYEEERDRPNLAYIRGDRWSLAVDAGHSREHTQAFYRSIEAASLPLPELTVLTHWHWDHTFGMHSVHGLCIANEKTNRYLADFRDRLSRQGTGFFLAMDESIRLEYAGGKPVTVTLADIVFSGEMLLDAGSCPIRIFRVEAPHTDDSTLMEVPGEKALILSDCAYGTFPDWTADPVKAAKLAETVRTLAPDICLQGHQPPLSPETVIRGLLEEDI